MRFFQAVAVLLSVHVSVVSAGCSSDLDCRLLGVCKEGACVCDSGWIGDDCGTANLAPFTNTGYVNATSSSWGGNAVLGPDGKWHLFFSELGGDCPLLMFRNVSMVSHAVSDDLFGNFTLVEHLRMPFAHNTSPVPVPGGGLAIYLISSANETVSEVCPGRKLPSCATRVGGCATTGLSISAMYSANGVKGPFDQFQLIEFKGVPPIDGLTNPTVSFLPNGTAVMIYRGQLEGQESLAFATGESWSGPFTFHDTVIVGPHANTGSHEDPHLWIDTRGHFHIITHNQGQGRLCPESNECGAHIYSEDLLSWYIQPHTVYNASMPGANFPSRQRPQITFDASGKPLALWNGGSLDGSWADPNGTYHTYSFTFQH